MSSTEIKLESALPRAIQPVQEEKPGMASDPGVSDPMLEDIRTLAESRLKGARGSHDWDHTLRVFHLCRHIGSMEGADMTVLTIAAFLHDIGRSQEDTAYGEICHAEKGAEIAEILLKPFPLADERKANVIHCIRAHRFRNKHIPETLEARVLFDADKLDAIGAVGVARAFLFAGEVGARLHSPEKNIETTRPYSEDDTGYREYKIKLRKIRDRMMTREGKRLARGRHDFMEAFFNRFLMEYEGKG